MSWSETFLGLIALATVVMAVIQVGAVIAAGRVMRQAQQTLATVQQEIRPLVAKARDVAEDAKRTSTIAAAQAEKVDRLVSELAVRVDETAAVVQQAIIGPAREGMAVVAALKAGLTALRGVRSRRPRTHRTVDEEDPLFIG
ncbi:MAG TPA: DUF948 domain-containing protein [Vicinamibacterales bacterium]|nr:DUF948 domain-containing protein [Vicinamibacterales bacterium]